jgi:hypothetical protein
MSENDTASTTDDHTANHSSQQVSTVTGHDTMVDLANWWCHYILQNSKLELFDEFSEVLQFLAPIREGSPLSIRLHCLVVWQELLTQVTPRISVSTNSYDEDHDHTTTPTPPPLESRTFEAVQDNLVLLHTKYFRQDTAVQQEYLEVLRMVRVHQELSILYGKLKNEDDNPENVKAALDQALQKGRDDIFFYDSHRILPALQDIVMSENGFTTEKRMNGIVDVLNNDESGLAVNWLLLKTQMVLLHWCERRIPGGTPVLVKSKFRGVGIFTRDPSGGSENTASNDFFGNAYYEENTGSLTTLATALTTTATSRTNENTVTDKNHPTEPQSTRLRVPHTPLVASKRIPEAESRCNNTTNTSPNLASPNQSYKQHSSREEPTSSRRLETLGDLQRVRETESRSYSSAHTSHSTILTKKMMVKSKLVDVAVVWTKEEKKGRERINAVCLSMESPTSNYLFLYSLLHSAI